MATTRKPKSRSTYHHGDLRAAMLKATVEELSERGVEGFTLRSCARRAGVSHAAPAHYFGNVSGLLAEVAIDAFQRLAETMRGHVERAERGSIDHAIAVALGYVSFALSSPAEFMLMFRSEKIDTTRPDLRMAGSGAFAVAVDAIGAFYKVEAPMSVPVVTRKVIAFWSLAHGIAALLIAGRLGPPEAGEKLAKALVPDMVRELLEVAAVNDPKDLRLIARTSAAQAA